MSKKYVFLYTVLLIVSSWFFGLQAREATKNSLWSYVGLERDFSDYGEGRLELDVKYLIDVMRGRTFSMYLYQRKDELEELLASKDLNNIIQRVLREESKATTREVVWSAGLGLTALAALMLSYTLFLKSTKEVGWKGHSYRVAGIPFSMISVLAFISLWVREVVKNGHIFKRGPIPSEEQVIEYIHALIAGEKNLESENLELRDKEEL